MLAKLDLTLHGVVIEQIIEKMVYEYALLTIKSRLDRPNHTTNAPWLLSRKGERGTVQQRHARWMRKIDKARLEYKRTLEPLIGELPPVPDKDVLTRSIGRPDAMTYSDSQARRHAHAYSRVVLLPEHVAIKALKL